MWSIASPFGLPHLMYNWNYYFLTQPRQPTGFSYFCNQDPYGFYDKRPSFLQINSDLNTNATPFTPSPKTPESNISFDHLDTVVDFVLVNVPPPSKRKFKKCYKYKKYRKYKPY